MAERKYDRKLHIKTVGLREWGNDVTAYNRYEATPYLALDKLFEHYKFNKGDHLVDFGSGRGRVAFYTHHRFQIPVTGVEANDRTFEEAIKNKEMYKKKVKNDVPIDFVYALAEQYEVDKKDNCFYFFNPFSLKIFKQVTRNILKSVKDHQREIDLILYYPLPEFKEFLKIHTPFRKLNKVKVPGIHGKYDKFVIYRLNEW